MRTKCFFLLVWLEFWLLTAASPIALPGEIGLTSPQTGEALQGVIAISGTTAIDGFLTAAVYFSYSQSEVNAWFLVQDNLEAVADGEIATWDTTTLTDGIYDLKLVVTLEDSSQKEVIIHQVRVRNYTQIETSTSTLQPAQDVVQSPTSPSSTSLTNQTNQLILNKVTSTPLPMNPAELTGEDLIRSLEVGGLIIVGLFLAGGVYLGWNKRKKH
jgi:hypothetical protein